ncbi:MAG TPA: four-carbon acid sugar kinase family protein [Bosea sp. (in: a-proteobacteria)]|uniref:four-carbon acid sugar kinase family protein n=1 Tax=Bosea sp. (in: a-proteobacteria) TaxID=1871050 RepID=UPI002DDD2C99|nr:four-carbon acid sugar kinase family protein [Bosea sp. (in: a-proteobacteria)]HEV2554555.1 four-carbon acid sugar kinase family protein [Bosea sp. (in: a-proteobacteria)]
MSALRPLPAGPLVAFYGDDFTGSSASMEALAFAGLETVLFLAPPTAERLAAFRHCRGIGIAGVARSRSPAWMDEHLPPIFAGLKALGAPILHYKVCSTFDSAPHIGSIGRAAEIGARLFEGWIPLVVGEPGMGRFQSFGHLFALAHGRGYRLDRHPVMARHPVTPMDEADLGRHLARQTNLPIGLVDFVAMKRGAGDAALDAALAEGAAIVSIDVMDAQTLEEAGRLLWQRGGQPCFAIGSQGVEAALVAHWRAAGLLPAAPALATPGAVAQIAVVSGSVSPVTARQIATAQERGFAPIRLAAERAVDARAWESEIEAATRRALAALEEGQSPLVFSAQGPDDPAVARLREAVATAGLTIEAVNDRIGAGLGTILDRVLREARLTRAVISGGDTSSHAAAKLGIDALTAIAPMAPGSPLCRAHAPDPERDGLELVLKGGQVGGDDVFNAVRRGGAA